MLSIKQIALLAIATTAVFASPTSEGGDVARITTKSEHRFGALLARANEILPRVGQ